MRVLLWRDVVLLHEHLWVDSIASPSLSVLLSVQIGGLFVEFDVQVCLSHVLELLFQIEWFFFDTHLVGAHVARNQRCLLLCWELLGLHHLPLFFLDLFTEAEVLLRVLSAINCLHFG